MRRFRASGPGLGTGAIVPLCRACQAKIIWARTPNGKAMPVDGQPVEDGNVKLERVHGKLTAFVLGPLELELEPDGVQLFKAHFATCPNAHEFRRRRPKKKAA